MDQKIKIVIIQTEILPSNFHWTCFQLPPDVSEAGFILQGLQVVELPKEEAEALLKKQATSHELQIQLAKIYSK